MITTRLDPVLRRAATVLTGTAAGSLLTVLATALVARSLGGSDFGVLVVVMAYVTAVDGLITFQSWQGIIHFGAGPLAHGDRLAFARLVRSGRRLDGTAAALGAALAVAGAPLLAGLLDWSDATVGSAMLYGLVIASNATGTAIGILRLHQRFALLGRHQVYLGGLRLVAAAGASVAGLGLRGTLVAWAVAEVVANVVLRRMAQRVLLAEHPGILDEPGSADGLGEQRGPFLRFLLATNAQGAVKVATGSLDVLLVGQVLGVRDAGIYRVGKQLSSVVSRVVEAAHQAVYPELATAWARRDREGFIRTARRTSAGAAAAAAAAMVVVGVAGPTVLRGVFGRDFAPAYAVTMWLIAGLVVFAAAVPLPAAMLAAGRPHRSLFAMVVGTAAYLACLVPLLDRFGVAGGGAAPMVLYGLWSAILGIGLPSVLRGLPASSAQPPREVAQTG